MSLNVSMCWHVDIGTEYHKNFSKPTLERDTRTSKFLVDTRTAPATLERPMATLERNTKTSKFLVDTRTARATLERPMATQERPNFTVDTRTDPATVDRPLRH